MEQRNLLIMALFLAAVYAADPTSVESSKGSKLAQGSALMIDEVDLANLHETVESRGIPSNGKRFVAKCTSPAKALFFNTKPSVYRCNLAMVFDANNGYISSSARRLTLSVPILTNLEKTEQVLDFTDSRRSVKQVMYFFSKLKELRIKKQSCEFVIMDAAAGNETLVTGNYYQRWMCGD